MWISSNIPISHCMTHVTTHIENNALCQNEEGNTVTSMSSIGNTIDKNVASEEGFHRKLTIIPCD